MIRILCSSPGKMTAVTFVPGQDPRRDVVLSCHTQLSKRVRGELCKVHRAKGGAQRLKLFYRSCWFYWFKPIKLIKLMKPIELIY